MLLDIAKPRPFTNGDAPAIRPDASLENPQQRGLAGTVRTDEANPIAFIYPKRNVLE